MFVTYKKMRDKRASAVEYSHNLELIERVYMLIEYIVSLSLACKWDNGPSYILNAQERIKEREREVTE